MKRIILLLVAVAVIVVVTALPAFAQGVNPECARFFGQGLHAGQAIRFVCAK